MNSNKYLTVVQQISKQVYQVSKIGLRQVVQSAQKLSIINSLIVSLGKGISSLSTWFTGLIFFGAQIGFYFYQYKKVIITFQEFITQVKVQLGSTIVGTISGFAGGAIGSAIGTAIFPGLGTVIGYILGSVIIGTFAAYNTEQYLQEKLKKTPYQLYIEALSYFNLDEQSKIQDVENKKKYFLLIYHPDKAPESRKAYNKDANNGLQMNYKGGQNGFTFKINLICNDSYENEFSFINATDPPNIIITGYSSNACPLFTVSSIWKAISEIKYVICPLFIIIGLFMCFYGLKFYKIVFFIIGFIFILLVIMTFVSYFFLENNQPTWKSFLALGISAAFGIIAGVLACNFEKIGFVFLGLLLGVFLGYAIYDLGIFSAVDRDYALYLISGVLSIIFAVIAYIYDKQLLIIATSFLGASFFCKGIGLIFGGYPNEYLIAEEMSKGNFEFPYEYYYYFGGIVALTIIGIFYQCKKHKQQQLKDAKNNETSISSVNQDTDKENENDKKQKLKKKQEKNKNKKVASKTKSKKENKNKKKKKNKKKDSSDSSDSDSEEEDIEKSLIE